MDSIDLIRIIKRAAVDAVNATKPCDVVFGKVISENPLKIQIDQKLILEDAQLVLTSTVKRHRMRMKRIGGTYDDYVVDNRLHLGDRVAMLRAAGGQSYVVIDKLKGCDEEGSEEA